MKHLWKPLFLVASVFLFTGAIICMNDILLPALKDLFSLTYTEASLVQQCFYLVYLIFPIPIAFYISRFGYKAALITALSICSVAALIFIPAYNTMSFTLALTALFIISIGVTLINVAANPLAALLGDPSGAHVRVNIVQLFSRIGYSFTPLAATRLMQVNGESSAFHIPYLIIGAGTLLLAVFFVFAYIPVNKPALEKGFNFFSILKQSKKYPQLRWGALAMFFYMGVETCTAGFFISYLKEVAHLDTDETSSYLTYYYIISTITSFAGIYLINKYAPGKLLIIFAAGMVAMFLLASFTTSSFNAYYLLGVGVFISILFSLVFSLSIHKLDSFTERGSALVNMAIVGGAVFPPLQGLLADHKGIQISYLIPCFCAIPIIMYGYYCLDKQA